jgi:hypothetical protein
MIVLGFFLVALIGVGLLLNAYAESSILQDAIHGGIDNLGSAIDESIDKSDLDDGTKSKLYSVSRAGIDSADLFTSAWFSAHEFVVNALLAGSPIELPVAIITMVSVGISTFLLFLIFKEIKKKAKWIILIVVGVIILFLAIGSSPVF